MRLRRRDDGAVKDLEVRLAALDPDAGAAVRVIAYFDQLTAGRAGLEAIVRGAAVLAGCPARLADDARRLSLRVEPDGACRPPVALPDNSWLSAGIGPDGGASLWLERPGPMGPVDAMILERAAVAARAVLDRTRGRAPALPDDALVELLIDENAPAGARRQAARAVGLAETRMARAIAVADGTAPARPRIEPADGGSHPGASLDPHGPRAGVGPAADVLGLPASWAAARTALRFTAEGTADDPGPRIVHADELGGLALLATAISSQTPRVLDELALDHATAASSWMLATLDAVATSGSLRAAAATLRVHHSTLQERIVQAEHLLGWEVRGSRGRHRLYLVLALRRLRRHPAP
jgi:hypothetical protein